MADKPSLRPTRAPINSKRPLLNQSIVNHDAPEKPPPVPYANRKHLVPAGAEFERIPDDKLEEFLAYKMDGDSDTYAATKIGVDVRAIIAMLKSEQRFLDAYTDAVYRSCDTNEDRLQELCRAGNLQALKVWLEVHRPQKWGSKPMMVADIKSLNIAAQILTTIEEEGQRVVEAMPELRITDGELPIEQDIPDKDETK